MPNIAFSYCYRDASRYYRAHTVVFANPTHLAPEAVTAAFAAAPHVRDLTRLMGTSSLIFDPTALDLPEQYFAETSEADLDWHEFSEAAFTADAPTDRRLLPDFLAQVVAAPAFSFRTYDAFGVLGR